MLQHLHPKQYYIDLYDLFTVKECLDWYWRIHNGMEKHRGEFQPKEPHTDFDHEVLKLCSYTVNVLKGERYRHRADRVKEWMEKDERTQKRFDEAMPPIGIICKECGGPTRLAMKEFWHGSELNAKVWFMFECLMCRKRASYFEDGSEWISEKEKCPKCKNELDIQSRKEGGNVVDTVKCLHCNTAKEVVHDFDKSHREFEAKQEKDRQLLEKHRSEFCLNDENGPEYLRQLDDLIRFGRELKEQEKKEATPAYKKAKQLKKLRVHELQKLLVPILEKEGYVNFALGQPDMGRFVAINFTATDSKDGRDEYHSQKELKKLITNTLEDTNWRLMSEGISYRIGIVSGRLRAYEKEEDAMEMFVGNS